MEIRSKPYCKLYAVAAAFSTISLSIICHKNGRYKSSRFMLPSSHEDFRKPLQTFHKVIRTCASQFLRVPISI